MRKLGAGTPAYASLDMFLGLAPHSSDDVYSLAVVLYRWLSGRHPYRSGDPDSGPLDAPTALQMGLRPAPIRGLAARQNRALRRALALERGDRTQTVEELWRQMSAPVAGWPAGWRTQSVAALGALVALALAFLGVLQLRGRDTPAIALTASPAAAASPAGVSRPASAAGVAPAGAAAARDSSPPVATAEVARLCQGPPALATVEAALDRGIAAQTSLALQSEGSPAYTRAMTELRAARRCLRTLKAGGLSTTYSERWESQSEQRNGPLPADGP